MRNELDLEMHRCGLCCGKTYEELTRCDICGHEVCHECIILEKSPNPIAKCIACKLSE